MAKRTRKTRAAELLRKLEQGPSIGTIGRMGVTKEEAEADAKLWLRTWIIPEVKALIPELKEVKP